MTTSVEVRARIIELFRRDLVGPLPTDVCPGDADLQHERLPGEKNVPSWWYLAGFLAPVGGAADVADDPDAVDEVETHEGEEMADASEGDAARPDDGGPPERPAHYRRFLPSSLGLTVLVPIEAETIEVRVTWGDYEAQAEEPFSIEELGNLEASRRGRDPEAWQRVPREMTVAIPIPDAGKGTPVALPGSEAAQLPGGHLELLPHARPYTIDDPDDGQIDVRALTVFLVNHRRTARRAYADVTGVFQARLEVHCDLALVARRDLSGYRSDDDDHRLADLHYRDTAEYAVGRNTAAGWETPDAEGRVYRAWSDPLPTAEVERVAPNEDIRGVEFGMEALAAAAEAGGTAMAEALNDLPRHYMAWIVGQEARIDGLAGRRAETARRLVEAMRVACRRMEAGIALVASNDRARLAFRLMNLAVARAARRRNAGPEGDPDEQRRPTWRPFQLAFILLNLEGLSEKTHPDRELVDLLFFPTGGGKTEAYLGLAAYTIAHRRLSNSGLLGAGTSIIMRYTLRLLTLDQLSRAAGVICALELMRTDMALADGHGRPLLGDWPIEIGLWVGSDASPNILGGKGKTGGHTAVSRVRKYQKNPKSGAPAPLKGCPWCGTAFTPQSFACVPNMHAPSNMTITCTNAACDFTRDRPLPLLTVDEVIYRRLPAFVIATVDKFAGLPWLGEAGAFFGHVDRHDRTGFYGAAEPDEGTRLFNDGELEPPDLIIQDELHLISGPLGTVAGLYETAIDRLATRHVRGHRVRPKIVASTATVRRAGEQIRALFDRDGTQVFPPPGIDRRDSWFAHTLPSSESPARIYMGLAAQGRGPKVVFLRGLTTLMATAGALFEQVADEAAVRNAADPYKTAVCYFNALRELGGARRIVEDEVKDRLVRYGRERRRLDPADRVFVDRTITEPLELTSRVSTDDVAKAKAMLERVFDGGQEKVDVALATNMISVGLDILRLGLMLVQGQPKTAAEYIQATSRVGRDPDRPGLVVTVLNLHKPRDRAHYESFRLFHASFYRAVEATSVTPWAARALARGRGRCCRQAPAA